FAPLGQQMTDAAKPGLVTLDQTTASNAKAIKTSYDTTQQATVKSSGVWPNQMRAAALPGIQANQATIARSNQAVRANYAATHASTVSSANQMAAGVSAAGRTMAANLTSS